MSLHLRRVLWFWRQRLCKFMEIIEKDLYFRAAEPETCSVFQIRMRRKAGNYKAEEGEGNFVDVLVKISFW
ncbi:hypothetical protein DVH24_016387 [Malus domestica]|uniref:Uncharacterized protein n=1 Tax=Malus domestica TaxID=3750 RepID=A0A498HVM9_MALDO|nr:hypothetical protein DVH24_016387 [Malus domestica]